MIEKPVLVRLDPSLHTDFKEEAKNLGISMNKIAITGINHFLQLPEDGKWTAIRANRKRELLLEIEEVSS